MLRRVSTLIVGMSAFTMSAALAVNIPCNPLTVAGSYIREVTGGSIIDQLELHIDGTAAWYQSSAPQLLVTGGTFIRQIGSWKCVSATRLVVTTVGENYTPTQVPDPFSSNLVPDEFYDSFSRITHQLDLVNVNTLNRSRRVTKTFGLTQDPLDPNAVPIFNQDTTVPALFRRVVPLTSDLP
ncbi:MAG: hypothetical protein WCE48_02135 [Steroidobacteraceae bacterium]